MDSDTATKWASRIGNEPFTNDRINRLWRIIENKLGPYGSGFSFVGEERHAEFMIVTRRAVFRRGYKDMDPASIPQFKEGDEEKVLRRVLEEGVDHLEFATRLNSQG
ncbi:hypothetical protein ARMSODRAFT_1014879 [Armillaria solidipes]|uniref:Uncharacterized protein n=1 Tax=Armillaria solidipes TaxID=1076256 RepID=A0A2H3BWD3_9AGAR|nr:hypothetical protein ARMSODRAFT_1014879 [Armillaria solidipes]